LNQNLTPSNFEYAAHIKLLAMMIMDVYFGYRSSPWQSGIYEISNGLLRQCSLRGTCLYDGSQTGLEVIKNRGNARARKTLGFRMPVVKLNDVFDDQLNPARSKKGSLPTE
jgi:IS30 family transposase